jgi:fatty acid-binding protein DegV
MPTEYSLGLGTVSVVAKVPNCHKSIDALIESYSSKSESEPVKYYLSKSLKVFGFKYT